MQTTIKRKDPYQEAAALRILNELGGTATRMEVFKHWEYSEDPQTVTWRLQTCIKHGRAANVGRLGRAAIYQITDKGKQFVESISRIYEKV